MGNQSVELAKAKGLVTGLWFRGLFFPPLAHEGSFCKRTRGEERLSGVSFLGCSRRWPGGPS